VGTQCHGNWVKVFAAPAGLVPGFVRTTDLVGCVSRAWVEGVEHGTIENGAGDSGNCCAKADGKCAVLAGSGPSTGAGYADLPAELVAHLAVLCGAK